MCVLYSYMRLCDDFGDDPVIPLDERGELLDEWERLVRVTLGNQQPASSEIADRECPEHQLLNDGAKVLPALLEIVSQYSIPHDYLVQVIRGVRMDVQYEISSGAEPLTCRFANIDELSDYCYHVAGVVGLCCIHIWGFRDERAIERAIDCGLAFQLTNILRDLGEDARSGRVYLPAEDLARFGYTPRMILDERRDVGFRELMEFEVARAEVCYARANELFELLEPTGRPILGAMLRIYGGILTEIRRRNFDVYSSRISLPKWRKLWIAADALLRRSLGRR